MKYVFSIVWEFGTKLKQFSIKIFSLNSKPEESVVIGTVKKQQRQKFDSRKNTTKPNSYPTSNEKFPPSEIFPFIRTRMKIKS